MAVMVPVVVMSVRDVPGCKAVVIDRIGIMMVMVVIVRVESRYRSFVAQMTMQALRSRPGELERDDQHEEDGKKAVHRIILSESIWMSGRSRKWAMVSGLCFAVRMKSCSVSPCWAR